MKKYFLLLTIFLGCFSSSFASFNFEYFWTGDEEELFFNIDLHPNLTFDEIYGTFTTNDNELGCELDCKPFPGKKILSSEGYTLKEMKVIVTVKNIGNANEVQYEVEEVSTYKGVEDGKIVTTTERTWRKGIFDNPLIDLTQNPDFFWIDDQMSRGIIRFKNT